MKLTARNVHRDLAYFFLGLIIAFSISGIFLNHRQSWYPSNYVYQVDAASIVLPPDNGEVDSAFVAAFTAKENLGSKYRGFRIRDGKLRISYTDTNYEFDLKTGEGEREQFVKVPLLAQFTQLHVNTNGWWIWYSDIFGIAMLTIALTGAFIMRGKTGFKQRGWKLALAGIVFPLIFLFLLA